MCRAKKKAKLLALGMLPIEEIKYMAAVEESLIAKGNLFRRLYTTYDEQKNVIEKNARSEYNREVKRLKSRSQSVKLPPFNKKNPHIFESMKGLDLHKPILYGYVYSGAHVGSMLPLLKGIFVADAAHMKDGLQGTSFSLWGYHSDERLVCIALAYILANEDEDRWILFFNCVKEWYPQMQACAIITDGDKGIKPALAKVMPGWEHLLCYRHVASNVNKKCKIGKLCLCEY